jgi:hypothetical protein
MVHGCDAIIGHELIVTNGRSRSERIVLCQGSRGIASAIGASGEPCHEVEALGFLTCSTVIDGRAERNQMPRTYWQATVSAIAIELEAPQVRALKYLRSD